MSEGELRAERQLRRADAYMRGALDRPAPLRSLEEIEADARRWALEMRDGETALDQEFFAGQFDLIADLAAWLRLR